MKLVVMGTPEFAVPTLKCLFNAGHEIGYVVTQPDRKGNRNKLLPPSMKVAANNLGIKVLQPEKLSDDFECKAKLIEYEPDFIVVVAFGQILKKDILSLPKYGCFNVHGSILPKLRGAAPMQEAILNGFENTGVTIMKMDEGLDTGDMVAVSEVKIGRKNFLDIHDELAKLGGELMAETLPKIVSGDVIYTKQKDSEATYAGKISKKDGKIDFYQDSIEIDRKIRAFNPWPGAFCLWGEKNLKIWAAEPKKDLKANNIPGRISNISVDGIEIECGNNFLLVKEVQLQGKKRMSSEAFLRGHKLSIGEILK